MKIKAYQKDAPYSYTLGVFETIEVLEKKPKIINRVYLKSNASSNSGITIIKELCTKNNIEIIISDNIISKLSKKDNCFAIAIINKYHQELKEGNHVILVNPSNKGNMGTILRTMLGFDYHNLAIIRPGVDTFDPHVIRSSMGAVFDINIEYFDSFDDYLKRFNNHQIYSLMLKGASNIYQTKIDDSYHSLVFGNESSGLPDEYLNYGKSIFIPHSKNIDSLNLSLALGITLATFTKDKYKEVKILGGKMDV